jgi:heavy metal sensor kinase
VRFVRSIKFRLTIWYVVALVGLLLLFGIMAFFMLSRNLYQGLDDSLKTRAVQLENSLQVNDNTIALDNDGEGGFEGQPGELVLLYGTDGTLLQRFGPAVDADDVDPLVDQALAGHSSLVTSETAGGQQVRLYATPVVEESGVVGAAVVGRSPSGVRDVLRTFGAVLGFTGLVTVGLAGIGGLFLASRVLKPVDRMTQTAQAIGESDLSRRIEVHGDDELGRLASTLNQMMERLEGAVDRQRQFTADASHELRTPLSVIEAESTLALRKERTGDDYRKSLESISQETAYISAMIDKLLFLARSDAGKEQLNLEEVNLMEILDQLASDIDVLCQEKGLQFHLGPLEKLVARGDRIRLKQLFRNLLENAVRYTPSGGSISVSAVRQGKTAMIAVRDTGIGIPEEHLPHIFERFYRADKARSRADGGAGLGLSICQHIAEVHGGRIEVESRVGEGSTFSVFLPLVGSS